METEINKLQILKTWVQSEFGISDSMIGIRNNSLFIVREHGAYEGVVVSGSDLLFSNMVRFKDQTHLHPIHLFDERLKAELSAALGA